MPVSVASAKEAAGLDNAAINSGIASRSLMRSAAFNAATVICANYAEELRFGITIYTGSGNNGGDGWALAGALAAVGVTVHVREVTEPQTDDARAEKASASAQVKQGNGAQRVIVDAILGTGATGILRGEALAAACEIAESRARGAKVVALDLPSGVDADSGATDGCVIADLTISFGSCKRGSLISRDSSGRIVVVDIGLQRAKNALPFLVDSAFVRRNVPRIPANAHKGLRKSVAMVAGGENMGGAAILAATAALRSGVGLVQVVTAPANVSAMHTQIPEALVAPLEKAYATIENWADAVLIGPGLAVDAKTRDFIRDIVNRWRGPIVLDAGALSAFDGDLRSLGDSLRGRPAVMTPHPGELARLLGCEVSDVLARRFDIGVDVARETGATVLLKGTPTVAFGPDGERLVIAAGTPVLATGGSGDALSGIVTTLLAQACDPTAAAACAAWVHGRAAELTGRVRGHRLSDVLDLLPQAWELHEPLFAYPVLASLAAIV